METPSWAGWSRFYNPSTTTILQIRRTNQRTQVDDSYKRPAVQDTSHSFTILNFLREHSAMLLSSAPESLTYVPLS